MYEQAKHSYQPQGDTPIQLIDVEASERADIDPQDIQQHTAKLFNLGKFTTKKRNVGADKGPGNNKNAKKKRLAVSEPDHS